MIRGTAALAGLSLALAGCTTTAELGHEAPPPVGAPGVTVRDPRIVFVESAKAMLGQPYRYGGAAPGGFDCSGLVAYAGDNAGIHLPRTAQEQLRAGAPVPRAAVQAGDLVFMRLSHKTLHVGIAVGPGRFVHAPAAGRFVRIDSLDAPPYSGAFIAARRVPVAPSAKTPIPSLSAN